MQTLLRIVEHGMSQRTFQADRAQNRHPIHPKGDKLMVKVLVANLSKLFLAISILLTGAAAPSMGQATLAPQPVESPSISTEASLREKWLAASPEERVKLAEAIGDEGARQYARQQNWKPLFDGQGRGMPQGPDQIYYDPVRNKVVVIEAKGGTSPLTHTRGYLQGTPENVVKSAEAVLHNPNAPPELKEACRKVIEAAQKGNLEVQVVRTEHVLGVPKPPKVESVSGTTPEAQKLAQEVAEKYGIRDPFEPDTPQKQPPKKSPGHSAPKQTPSDQPPDPLTKTAKETAEESAEATARGARGANHGTEESAQEAARAARGANRGLTQAAKAADKAEDALSATKALKAAKAADTAEDGLSAANAAGKLVNGAGKVIAKAGPVVEVGLVGYRSYNIEAAYQRGEISREQRNREHVKNVAQSAGGAVGSWAGAKVGAGAGAAIGTAICPGIGTTIGGIVGGIVGALGGGYAGEQVGGAAVDAAMR